MATYVNGHIQAIGILESCFAEKFGAPRQSGLVPAAKAKLRIGKNFKPEQSLRGLEGFSHIWLFSYFHLNTNKIFRPTVHPPRLKGKAMGVFASRSPHRPSPIGLSLARLEKIAGDIIYLSGTDLVDGTPILDLKPYIPLYDSLPQARSGWVGAAKQTGLAVRFTPRAQIQIKRLQLQGRTGLFRLVQEALSLDPRNHRDRSQLHPNKVHKAVFLGCIVRFHIQDEEAQILSIVPATAAEIKARRVPAPPAIWPS